MATFEICFLRCSTLTSPRRSGHPAMRPFPKPTCHGWVLEPLGRGAPLSRAGSKALYHRQRARSSVLSVRAARRSSTSLNENDAERAANKAAALEKVMADINKDLGKNSVFRQKDLEQKSIVSTFPSGSLLLDYALGGGYPVGRIVEIYGHESSGKTTLVLHAIAEVQREGKTAALIDAEYAYESGYALSLGVDEDKLIISQPDSGEAALETVDRLIRSGAVDLICIDSVSALVPRAELEGEMGAIQVGGQARLMGQAMRKIAGNAAKFKCTIIFLNQIRYKVGVYGNPETTSGGLALRFFASMRLQIQQCGRLKGLDPETKKETDIGIRTRVKVKKSKVSPPQRQAEFDILFAQGISKTGDLLDAAEWTDVVERKGAWYSYSGAKLGQGREKVIQYLAGEPDLVAELERAVRERLSDMSKRPAPGGKVGIDLEQNGNGYIVDDDEDDEGLEGDLGGDFESF